LSFYSQGTGAINLAPGSSGVNISNGGTVTAITRTSAGASYTGVPSVVISAPTTAGGVQATASCFVGMNSGTVASGGTGYTLNDVLTAVGGTGTVAQFQVAGVSGGVVTAVTPINSVGLYSVVPTNPFSVTGGTGTGATLNCTNYAVQATFTITNAGSGYVEQPTVTFSGGGGSGAAAYAAVGGTSTVRSIGGTINFATPGGTAFSISDTNRTTVDFWQAIGSSGTVGLTVAGATANNSGIISSRGTGSISINTNSFAQEQLRVAHTASAVNFVQVTGAATGGAPTISSQGSDTNVNLNLTTKGAGVIFIGQQSSATTSTIRLSPSGGNALWASANNAAANYIQVTGNPSGFSPAIIARGSDTNIGLTLGTLNSGNIDFQASGDPNAGTGRLQLRVAPTPNAVNFLQATGGATGADPVLSAQGSDTNIDLVLQPKGTGALQAQQTDSTATGGNARGANAVDWQMVRNAAGQVASGSTSFVGSGRRNTASQEDSFVGSGFQNTASSSQAAVVNGANNQVTGQFGFIGSGAANLVNLTYGAAVGGLSNTASGYFGFIGNGSSNSTTSSSSVTTQSATMNGTTAVTLSGSNASIRVGQVVTGTFLGFPVYVTAVSGTSLTISSAASGSGTATLSFWTPHGVVVGGGNNQATGSYSFIGGGGDAGTASQRNVASGDWSFVGGGRGNQATNSNAVVCGGGLFGVGNLASGAASFIGAGYQNNNSGGFASAIVGGSGNSSGGNFAFVGAGDGNAANANQAAIMGGSYGIARSINGNHVFPACIVPIAVVQGTSQAALLVLARQTTDATATVLTSNSSAASTTNQVILPNNSAYFFRGEVVSGVTGGGNTKGWTIEGVIKRGANAASTTLVGTPTVTSSFADAGASTWTIAVTADTTNGGLAVTFTGQAATTIRTVAQIRTTEMTF
jgi:hypothetical protein